MCGICGMTLPVDLTALDRMLAATLHRGPDDGGTFVSADGAVGLGSRRLSIIDLSPAGHMPMISDDGRVVVAYNGEIYNYRELREQLRAAGHKFHSQTDTEVLIHGYEEWGSEVFARLNGIFALALWDQMEHRLLLARDRFGVKPLYHVVDDRGRLLFASEVKGLIAAGYRPATPDPLAIHKYLAFLWVPGPATMFTGVEKLPPGHWAEWRPASAGHGSGAAPGAAPRSGPGGQLESHRHWSPEFAPQPMEDADAAAELRRILESTVERQLVADVPVGVFLSGGLDSTALAALATRAAGRPATCFTIGFRPEDFALEQSSDDARYARLAAESLGAELHDIEVSPDVVDLLPKVVYHLDEPVADPAAMATYLICEAARSKVTVLLSGQGADEVFAGYRVQAMSHWADRAGLLPAWLRRTAVSPLVQALPALSHAIPGVHPGLVLAGHRYLSKMLAGVDLPPDERYVFYRSYYTDEQLRGLYAPGLRGALADAQAGSEHLTYMREAPAADFLNRVLYTDWLTFLPELNLAYCDKMSMAASTEVRVPFLDNEIVDFMLTVPCRLKQHGRASKIILRDAVRDMVPAPVIERRKAGFGVPLRTWLRRDLCEMVDDLLGADRIKARGYFEPKAIRTLVDDDREGRADNTYRIWALLTLELWHQVFLDGRVPE
jgi:asparagine synthase (glutamine-hydrolysing)